MTTLFSKSSVLILMLSIGINIFAQDYVSEANHSFNVIKYANCVTELNNAYAKPLNDYRNLLMACDRNIAMLMQNAENRLTLYDCKKLSSYGNEIYACKNKFEDIQPFSEKNEIDRMVAKAENASLNVLTFCDKMNNYFSQKQYKNDTDFAQYKILKEQLHSAVRQASALWFEATQAATRAADNSELNLLKYSDKAEFVVPMKTNIIMFKELLNAFGAGVIDYAQIRQKLQRFSNSINQNKNLSGRNFSKLSSSFYQTVYNDFYQHCTNGAFSITNLAQLMEQNADADEIRNIHSKARTAYSSAIDAYNSFIKQ